MTGPKIALAPTSGHWQDRAECTKVDPEIFFPSAGGAMTKAKARQIADAKAVCKGCPVKAECLADAIASGRGGIWGGLTEDERDALRPSTGQPPRRTKPPTPSPKCGEYAGAGRHRRLGERFCDDCRDARNEYETKRKRDQRRAARQEAS